jgi:hypothetical protein
MRIQRFTAENVIAFALFFLLLILHVELIPAFIYIPVVRFRTAPFSTFVTR